MGFCVTPDERIATPTLGVEKYDSAKLAVIRALLVREISSTLLRKRPAARTSVPPACRFEQEPRATLGLIDPYFDETCRRDVTIFVTDVVRFA